MRGATLNCLLSICNQGGSGQLELAFSCWRMHPSWGGNLQEALRSFCVPKKLSVSHETEGGGTAASFVPTVANTWSVALPGWWVWD